ncbi:MAG: beta-ketoacyl synthase N-terminal-like domain-containing protein [Nakamurella sp.]
MTRAVITGLGVIAPSGTGTEEHWAATVSGRQCVTSIKQFDTSRYATTLAGQVDDFVGADFVDDRILVQTDRWTHFSLAAAALALADGDYDPSDPARSPYDTGVVLGVGSGGNEFGQREISALWTDGREAVSAYQSIAWFYAASTGQTSIRHQTKGPSGVVVTEAAGGLDSLAQARRVIRRGTGAVLAGATEAALTPYALTCQMTSGRLSVATEPERAYKPFDVSANGYVLGEGGAILLVEDAARAANRGSPHVYGEIAGYGATHDGDGFQSPLPDPRFYAAAMRRALADAELSPEDIDVVYADGAGDPDLDRLEARALTDVFGARRIPVPVTAPQGLIGRLSAGGSAVAVANALLSIRHGVIPAVGNLDTPFPGCDLDLVRRPRSGPVQTVMVNARGIGGFNSSLIVRGVEARTG